MLSLVGALERPEEREIGVLVDDAGQDPGAGELARPPRDEERLAGFVSCVSHDEPPLPTPPPGR